MIDFNDPRWLLEFHATKIGQYTDDQILEAIKEYPFVWSVIANPKYEWTLAAVTLKPDLLAYIDHPSVELQRLAVSKNPYSVSYIKNLDDDLALELLTANPQLINYFNDPSEMIRNYSTIIQ